MFIKIGIKKTLLLLGLVTILLTSFVIVVKTYALDEFIDDYVNYNNVQARNDVERNAAINAMELEYNIQTVADTIMDIWTTGGFTEVDLLIDNIKNVNGTRIWFDDVDRDEGDRIYKDFGINYYDSSFHYHFRVYIPSTHTGNARCYFMAFSEQTLSIYDTWINNLNFVGFFIQWSNVLSEWQIQLRMYNGSVLVSDDEAQSGELKVNVWYHVDYIRNGDNVLAYFYDDALMTNLDFLLNITHSNVDNLRYFHPLNAENRATGGRSMDLYLNRVHNFTTIANYEDDGYFYTNEVLSALNNNTIVLLTNSTIPSIDSITVEFSNDNLTWVDHNGIAGSDNLIIGYESIDIRDLSYTVLYMRFNFTDGGADSTPRLYQIRVITTDIISVGGGSGAIGFIVASFILVPCLLVFWLRRKRRR